MDMLSVLDVKEAIFKYRVTISEHRYAIYQAVDEVQKVTSADIPSTSQARSELESEIATVRRDDPLTCQPNGPPDGESTWHSYIDEQYRRMNSDVARRLRDVENNIINKIDEQTAILRKHIDSSLEDMQMLHQQLHSTLIEKLDEVMGSIAELQDIPGLPYFSDQNVGLQQRLVAFIQIGWPLKLHFMCENPSQPHYVDNQMGLSLTNLLPGEGYKTLRPLILGSIKILFILVKAGLHVAAGIGGAVPDFNAIPGIEPIVAMTLTGDTIMQSIKGISSTAIDSTLREAWGTIQSVIAPVKAKGQIPKIFQLYQVQYKSKKLGKYLSGTKRGCFWVCEKCQIEANKANLLRL
ncbi:unnamed protein product [Calypogeia fissa]